MNIIDVVQGSPEWIAVRAKYRCASEAPAMMGASKYLSRTELLRQKSTGLTPDIDPATQRRFDSGHAAEAAARSLVEGLIGDELFPATAADDANYLLASFDGITMGGETGYEHKLWNEDVAAQVRSKDLSPMYYWQIEQQILVGGLERIIFVCSDGTPEKLVHMEYRAVPGRAEQLLAGWEQFDKDLATYTPQEVIPAAVATPTRDLPALSIQVNGAISLISNLDVFGAQLAEFIDALDKSPSDDQAFADTEAAIKTLEKAQSALESAEAGALAQTASIDEMRRTVALYAGQARTTRLMLEKLVKTRKETLRAEIVQAGKGALHDHRVALNKRLGRAYMPEIAADFAGVVKGKKSITSLRDAVDTELARAKIEANVVADRIQINLTTLAAAKGHEFLFADIAQIVLKANDDFEALVKMRIADHEAAEYKRIEADRERIRAEEAAKLQREQQARENAAADAARQASATPAGQPNIAPPARAPMPTSTFSSTPAVKPTQSARPSSEKLVEAVGMAFGVDDQTAHKWLTETFQKQAA